MAKEAFEDHLASSILRRIFVQVCVRWRRQLQDKRGRRLHVGARAYLPGEKGASGEVLVVHGVCHSKANRKTSTLPYRVCLSLMESPRFRKSLDYSRATGRAMVVLGNKRHNVAFCRVPKASGRDQALRTNVCAVVHQHREEQVHLLPAQAASSTWQGLLSRLGGRGDREFERKYGSRGSVRPEEPM